MIDINSKNKKNQLLVFMTIMIILRTIMTFSLCALSKSLQIYGDELIYYSLARNIYYGDTFSIHGAIFPFFNVAYSFFLAPFFAIDNSIIRIQLITLFQSFILSSLFIPFVLICKELKVKTKYLIPAIILLFFWPDLLTAGTFMSENLYCILFLFSIYLCIKSFSSEQIIWTVCAALVSFLAFWCKEIGLCIIIAYLLVLLLYNPIVFILNKYKRDNSKDGLLIYLQRKILIKVVIIFLVFIICYLLFKKVFFNEEKNWYLSQIHFGYLKNKYNILYAGYGFVYYLLSVLLAFFIIPIIYPLIYVKKMKCQSLFTLFFSFILLLGSIIIIVLSITVREDSGLVAPRIHLRYISTFIYVFTALFFSILSNDISGKNNNSTKYLIYCFGLFFLCMFFCFKGIRIGCLNENLSLMYIHSLYHQFPSIIKGNNKLSVFPGTIILVFIGLFITFVTFILRKGKRIFHFLFVVAILASVYNLYLGKIYFNNTYRTNKKAINEMFIINNYFNEKTSKDMNVMFVTDNWASPAAKIYDTYFDGKNKYEIMKKNFLSDICFATAQNINTRSINWHEPVFGGAYWINNIDYYIFDNNSYDLVEMLSNIELIEEISGVHFRVYRCHDSEKILINKENLVLQYNFSNNRNNIKQYDIHGIYDCEGDFSWSQGNILKIPVHFPASIRDAKAEINIYNTLGLQKIFIFQGNNIVGSYEQEGEGLIELDLKSYEDNLDFYLFLPDATTPKSLKINNDTRCIAIALKSIKIKPIF